MSKTAYIFPGQGSQIVGMGKDFYNQFDEAKEVYKKADEVLGYSISDICFNGDTETLNKTKNTQPAILTTSLAILEVIKKQYSAQVSATAGHSLGEYGSLFLAGVLPLETAIKITSERAKLMNEAAENTQGGMAAVLGLSEEDILRGIEELSPSGVISVANYNCPGQIVITGEKELIEKSQEVFKNLGAKRVVPLAVSGAFHSQLMGTAADKFAEIIKDIEFNDAKIPVYENIDGMKVISGNELKHRLPKQIYSSVMWTQTVENMIKDGIDTFVEIGSGKVLSGLVKKINSDVKILNVNSIETLESTLKELGE